MCRISVFPPGFKRNDAIDILLDMQGINVDGVGTAFVRNGEFVTYKNHLSLSRILRKKNNNFLSNMPYNGWTLAHLRNASHGKVCDNNCHPFVFGNNCVIHNGIFDNYKILKLALNPYVNFKTDVDSEVAAHLISSLGPKKFSSEISFCGVFVVLKRSGKLWVIKTSGDLKFLELKGKKILISSEFPFKKEFNESVDPENGWYLFSENGTLTDLKKKEVCWGNYYGSGHFYQRNLPAVYANQYFNVD